eukprot:CAMPEP_0202942900 /NCGR_PEP_ID=MMETSP1395-20130829/3139_1 /ASSEMBLY_ACC=CAM_ASM_000871 /TAXON_ID=5961 /ORGANISM="Blepharisma japonicum, Strain Stock R1072" /LENGTH=764 /DNA_ID=CAMNT_0049639667 /DNA_START=109 /DNA_END=2400 /DNA_ORIENTATION=-
MINTLYQEKSGEFLRKKALLTIQAIVDGQGMKKVGTLSLNISEYYNSSLEQKIFAVEKCTDKNAKICISIHAQPLGDLGIADNMSEASGVTGFSMGTEGDFDGPLFDQDIGDLEEEAHAPKIIPTSVAKQSINRPILKLPDIGPVNPLKITQAFSPKPPPDSETPELKAKLEVLEKEKTQLKAEKDQLKVDLGVQYEKAKKERQQYIDYTKKLDTDLDALSKKNEALRERNARRNEKIKILKQTKDNLLNDLQEAEKSLADGLADKEVLKSENNDLRDELRVAKDNLIKLEKQNESLKQDFANLENSYRSLQDINAQLKMDLESIRQEFAASRETLTARGMENDSVFNDYKKKTEVIINDYKRELKNLEHEREEALSKQTELTLELQKTKAELTAFEEKFRDQSIKLERELNQLRENNAELNQRAEEEIQSRKQLKEKMVADKAEFDSKLAKITQNYQETKAKKDQLEQSILEYERQLHRKQTEQEGDTVNIQKFQDKIESLEKNAARLKQEIKEKDKEIEEIYRLKEALDEENTMLSEQLKKATTTEFSDPANIILQEQIQNLENKLKMTELAYKEERNSLHERMEILENQIEILEGKNEENSAFYEDQLHKLTVENQLMLRELEEIRKEKSFTAKTNAEMIASMQEEHYKQNLHMLEVEVADLKTKLSQSLGDYKTMEKKYVDSKLSWANVDLERETLIQKYKDAQEQLRDYSSQCTVMEVELYKINERFGQTLNNYNELEMENHNLRQKLEEYEKPNTGKK